METFRLRVDLEILNVAQISSGLIDSSQNSLLARMTLGWPRSKAVIHPYGLAIDAAAATTITSALQVGAVGITRISAQSSKGRLLRISLAQGVVGNSDPRQRIFRFGFESTWVYDEIP
jgi:hypothetical protein